MNNPYILPICLAVAAHGALLFGFTKNPVRVVTVAEEETYRIPMIPPAERDDPPIVESEPASAKPKSLSDAPQPIRSPEPLVLDMGPRPTMDPPPIQPVGEKELRSVLEPLVGTPGGTGPAMWNKEIVGSGLLDNPPRTRFQATPMYPYSAKRDGMKGEVFVDFMVDEQGRVIEPRIVKSSHPIFDEPTLRAVAKWRFEPGRRDGKIVKFRMTVPVIYNLDESS